MSLSEDPHHMQSRHSGTIYVSEKSAHRVGRRRGVYDLLLEYKTITKNVQVKSVVVRDFED